MKGDDWTLASSHPEWDFKVLTWSFIDGFIIGRYDSSWIDLEGCDISPTHWIQLPAEPNNGRR